MNSLSRREEETLLKTTKAHALRECDVVVKEFAACASGRTISVAWACRNQLKQVQDCMVQFTGPESMEQVRKEYLRLRNLLPQESS
jgi:COX assembly protein 1